MTRADCILETLTETFVDRVTLVQESSGPSLEDSGHQNDFQVEEVAAAVVDPSVVATPVNPRAMAPEQGLIERQGGSRGLQNQAAEGAIGAMPFELDQHQH